MTTREGLALHEAALPASLSTLYPLGGNTVMDYTAPSGAAARLRFDIPRVALPGTATADVTLVYFEGALPEGLTGEDYDPAAPAKGQIGVYTLPRVAQGLPLASLDIPLDADGDVLGAPGVLDGRPARGFSRTGVIDEEKSLATVGADAAGNVVFVTFPEDPAEYLTLAYDLGGMENAPAAPGAQTLFTGTALEDELNGAQALPAGFVVGKTTATDDSGVT